MQSGIVLPKLEMLIRLGLLPINIIPVLRRALLRVKTGMMLTPEDRAALGMLIDKVLSFSLEDPVSFQRLRTHVTKRSAMNTSPLDETANPMKKSMKKLTPEMLVNLSRSIFSKKKKGKKMSKADLVAANRAKAYNIVKHKLKKKATPNVTAKESYEIFEDRRREEFKRMPEGMLNNIANNVYSKVRAGGKISPEEKKLASRAKAELRRRRDNLGVRLGEDAVYTAPSFSLILDMMEKISHKTKNSRS
jgi:hypothetical protein